MKSGEKRETKGWIFPPCFCNNFQRPPGKGSSITSNFTLRESGPWPHARLQRRSESPFYKIHLHFCVVCLRPILSHCAVSSEGPPKPRFNLSSIIHSPLEESTLHA